MPEPTVGEKIATCNMSNEPPYIVPTATPGGCKGKNIKTYWDNPQHGSNVQVRVYERHDSDPAVFNVYKATYDPYPFQEYHDLTQAGADVRQSPGGTWVGIILDYTP